MPKTHRKSLGNHRDVARREITDKDLAIQNDGVFLYLLQ